MRKWVVAFFILVFLLYGSSFVAYASDCSQDNLGDKFGDWFATVGKKDKRKARIIASRKANRLADCTEKKMQEKAQTV
jgi:hypothetical protein